MHQESLQAITTNLQLPPQKKETKEPNTKVLCEYKPMRTLVLAQTRKPYSSMF